MRLLASRRLMQTTLNNKLALSIYDIQLATHIEYIFENALKPDAKKHKEGNNQTCNICKEL